MMIIDFINTFKNNPKISGEDFYLKIISCDGQF